MCVSSVPISCVEEAGGDFRKLSVDGDLVAAAAKVMEAEAILK